MLTKRWSFFGLALGALGVVYGDIGTSPLYAVNQVFFGHAGVTATPVHVYGAVSLIFWLLTLVLTGKYGDLLNTVVFADWIFFGLTVAGLFLLRKRLGTPEGFKTPGYPWLPAMFVLIALAVVYSVVREAPVRAAAGAGLLALGIPVYFIFKRATRRNAVTRG